MGPAGPFPEGDLCHPLDRQWLHYAFVSRRPGVAMVANLSILGPPPEQPHLAPQRMAILLMHDPATGWESSQFNAEQPDTPWSSFRLPHPHGVAAPLRLRARTGSPQVDLMLQRTGRPCTSQCAPFGDHQHLRWQSEPGVSAVGEVWVDGKRRQVDLVGYHERVRGRWSWPALGGWVFGFAIDSSADPSAPPPAAVVFTLIQPAAPADATTGSVMVWRHGRLRRHFSRRNLEVVVQGELDRDRVVIVPPLAATLGTPPTAPVPRRLVISARSGDDWLVLDFDATTAARIVNASETSLRPFSVHEVLGPCAVEGVIAGAPLRIEADGVTEFAGGAIDD